MLWQSLLHGVMMETFCHNMTLFLSVDWYQDDSLVDTMTEAKQSDSVLWVLTFTWRLSTNGMG